MFYVVFLIILLVIYMQALVDQFPRLGKGEGFLLPLGARDGYLVVLWHSLGLPYDYSRLVLANFTAKSNLVSLAIRFKNWACNMHLKVFGLKLTINWLIGMTFLFVSLL